MIYQAGPVDVDGWLEGWPDSEPEFPSCPGFRPDSSVNDWTLSRADSASCCPCSFAPSRATSVARCPTSCGEVLALVKRLTTDVPRLLLHLVGELAESLILHLSPRDEHPNQETDGDRANSEADRVFLCHAYRLPRLPFHLVSVRQCVAHA